MDFSGHCRDLPCSEAKRRDQDSRTSARHAARGVHRGDVPKVDWLLLLDDWVRGAEGQLTSLGVSIRMGRTRDDRPKHSAWVELERNDSLGELIVWSSGEADLTIGGPERVDLGERHELKDRESSSIGYWNALSLESLTTV